MTRLLLTLIATMNTDLGVIVILWSSMPFLILLCRILYNLGSQTLNQWRSLAMPNLGAMLEPRPGVQVKGQPKQDDYFEEETYSISDYEEDGSCQTSLVID